MKRFSEEKIPLPISRTISTFYNSPSRKKKSIDRDDQESWEDLVQEVQTVFKSNSKEKFSVELLWKDQSVSTYLNTVVNLKCPQKMISFYEKRLTFEDCE